MASCLRPKLPDQNVGTTPQPVGMNNFQGNQKEVQAARRGLLKAMQASVAPRFSSKPIDMEDYFSDRGGSFISDGNLAPTPTHDFRSSLVSSSNLTPDEREYLNNLLQSEDLDSIRRASLRLADKELFPPAETPSEKPHKVLERRDSEVQQQLFRLHENSTVKPSTVLRRMSTREIRAPAAADLVENNSITQENESWDMDSDDGSPRREKPERKWNPFVDVSSWINGGEGVEVDDEGHPNIPTPTSSPFKILGTSSDDNSCHPHVLSPPLMEGLQAFMPESFNEYHYWLKYSLVRDGGNLMTMLRHCRASPYTILAIETTDGHVFGSFTAHPWRLFSTGFYGSKESFVWRMRRSRMETCKSIVEQVLRENKIDVFPVTCRNNKVQLCSAEKIVLGQGEVPEMSTEGTHYGNAIQLGGSMMSGTTSTSETFGNPCLINSEKRGEKFTVANIEMWALTPHDTVQAAAMSEMKTLFLEEGRNADKNLNLLEILVGSPSIS